ncbi:MAG: FKBP-type peptidyl-prolyl cis-trans isomerase [Myxococcota bacterium]
MKRRNRTAHALIPTSARWLVIVLGITSFGLATAGAQEEASDPKKETNVVEAGSTVGIEYKLTLEDGTVVDQNVGEEALRFEQGAGQIIPGLDKELLGMQAGESKQVKVTPEDGYGPINPDAYTEVPVSELPEDARTPGAELMARDESGRSQRLRVDKIEGETATLDFNHPLAGKTLVFDVKILEVQ